MQEINIVMSSDNNYAQHMGVSILSILENKNPGYKIIFYVLDGGISEDNKIKINKVINNYQECELQFIMVDQSIFKNCPELEHFTIAAYYRIMAPEIIKVDKLLYLDCDTIIIKDLYSLYSTNLENHTLAAINDVSKKHLKKIFFRHIDNYFNSGIMLINNQRWIKNNISQKALEFINNEESVKKIKYADQDILNHLLENEWLELSNKYNYQVQEYNPKIIQDDIHIIHYISNHKPWHYIYSHPLKLHYLKYLALSPWKNYNLLNSKDKRIKIKKILHKIGLCMQRYLPQIIIRKLVKIKHTITK